MCLIRLWFRHRCHCRCCHWCFSCGRTIVENCTFLDCIEYSLVQHCNTLINLMRCFFIKLCFSLSTKKRGDLRRRIYSSRNTFWSLSFVSPPVWFKMRATVLSCNVNHCLNNSSVCVSMEWTNSWLEGRVACEHSNVAQ